MAEVIKNVRTFDSGTFTTYPIGAEAENVALSSSTQTALADAGIEATDVDTAIANLMSSSTDDIIVIHFSEKTDDDGNTIYYCDEYDTVRELYDAVWEDGHNQKPVIAIIDLFYMPMYIGIGIGLTTASFISFTSNTGVRSRYPSITIPSSVDDDGNLSMNMSKVSRGEASTSSVGGDGGVYGRISYMIWWASATGENGVTNTVYFNYTYFNNDSELKSGEDSDGNTILTNRPSGLLFGDDAAANRIATDMEYYNNDNKYYNSTITLNNTTLTGLSDPENDSDAVNKSYVDDNKEVMILTFSDRVYLNDDETSEYYRYISPNYSWDEVYEAIVNDNKIVMAKVNNLFYYPVQNTTLGCINFMRCSNNTLDDYNGFTYYLNDANSDDINGIGSIEILSFCSSSFVNIGYDFAYMISLTFPSTNYVDSKISTAISDAIGDAIGNSY